ncbi:MULTISPECIES: hypothetical protein [Micromonospora]|uniref:Uncharacterized protein n=1 Tax=Micromonospora sicca TaxID=2202420 RepID=A0A317D3Q0_9ACTN|nr:MULTISPECIES: hypothetical protein [unclassified Micromonospora]MBM0227379.1 hypothetical protein [Micromonospora sp. ATA51]PWR08790.1 hypothetical protein DKT69_32230 [Micromonospora sp. 4G51]
MGKTWGVAVEYQGVPVEYPEDGSIDERVELASMTVDGESKTRITASVAAETEEQAREIGAAGIAELARSLRLPAEPVRVLVTD